MHNLCKTWPQAFNICWGGGSSSDVVAKVVLEAVTTKNHSLRYLAGKDMETWMEAKTSMSDEEFHNMMKQNLMK
jgi:hypothetical protein